MTDAAGRRRDARQRAGRRAKEPDADPCSTGCGLLGRRGVRCRSPSRRTRSSVRVVNGSGVPNGATEVLDGLVAHGFHGGRHGRDGDRSDYPLPRSAERRPGGQGAHRGVVPRHRQRGRRPVPTRPVARRRAVIVGQDWDDLRRDRPSGRRIRHDAVARRPRPRAGARRPRRRPRRRRPRRGHGPTPLTVPSIR